MTADHVPFSQNVISQPMHPAHNQAYLLPAQPHGTIAAIIAASQSIHQKRASDVLAEFDALIVKSADPVGKFLLHYTCCDALALLLIGSCKGKPPHEVFGRKAKPVNLRSLVPAVKRLGVRITPRTLQEIFQADRRKGNRSCRMLRNGLMHGLQRACRLEVERRQGKLIGHMTRFISVVRSESEHGHHF